MRPAFTILEILIIVIIIALLVVISIPQYTKLMERQQARLAREILRLIRGAQIRYYMEHDSYSPSLSKLDIGDPNLKYGKFFWYRIESADKVGFVASATRKEPSRYSGEKIYIDQDNRIWATIDIYGE